MWSKCTEILNDVLVDMQDNPISREMFRRLNERDLHHYFSSMLKIKLSDSTDQGQPSNSTKFNKLIEQWLVIHPEWPSWKKGERNKTDPMVQCSKRDEYKTPIIQNDAAIETPIYYCLKNKEQDRSYLDRAINDAASNGSFDFAVGKYESPDVLLEFKWNNQYEEWGNDFMKLMDLRLVSNHRIFFGVRPCAGRGSEGGTMCVDDNLNSVPKLVVDQAADKIKKLPYRALFVDVVLKLNKKKKQYELEQARLFYFPKGTRIEHPSGDPTRKPTRNLFNVKPCLWTKDSPLA